jgi:hypothetical protein
MLDDTLLDEFCHGFFGYGNPGGRFWFIGLEEGGGGSEDEIRQRLSTWSSPSAGSEWAAKAAFVDLVDFHHQIGQGDYFNGTARLPLTWRHLIRLLLCARGEGVTGKAIRTVLATEWGRSDGETCLAELYPVPSPGVGKWLIGEWSRLPYLRSRSEYKKHLRAPRIATLRRLIEEHRPPFVVFYGRTERSAWEEIAGCPLPDAPVLERRPVLVGKESGTTYLLLLHPNAPGTSSEYFCAAGRLLRSG